MERLWILVFVSTLYGSCSPELAIYPHAKGLVPSNKFSVRVSQGGDSMESFTYISTSNHRVKDARSVKANRSVSWSSFAFSGQPVDVLIQASRDFNACYVRPRRYGIACQAAAPNTAHITITQTPTMLSVEFDTDQPSLAKDITDKLLIFADAPEILVPSRNDPDVMFFGVGIHDLNGQLHLPYDIRQVYLAPGAFVQGGFITTGDRPVNITGRGIMSGATYPFHDPRFTWGIVNMDNGSHHLLEGVTLVDSPQFFVRGQSSFNTVRNVKMLAPWTYNSDGVGIGMNGLVEDSFIWANDDTFKVYQSDLVVRRCIVWQGQNGAVFQMGWWSARRMSNATLEQIDVIHTDWCTFKSDVCSISNNDAVLDLAGDTSTFLTSGLKFRNINLEDPCPRVVNYQMNSQATGTVSNFLFVNWTMPPHPNDTVLHNIIAGSRNGQITDWTFYNFTAGGRCTNNPTSNNFVINNSTTSNIRFVCP